MLHRVPTVESNQISAFRSSAGAREMAASNSLDCYGP